MGVFPRRQQFGRSKDKTTRPAGHRPRLQGTGRHRCRALLEALEDRVLLSAAPQTQTVGFVLGMNLSAVEPYSTAPLFNDAMKEANSTWNVVQATSLEYPWSISGVPLPPLDANGYPIGLGNLPSQGYALSTFVFTSNNENYPTGTYTLIVDGKGTIVVHQGNGTNQTFTLSGGLGAPQPVNIVSTNTGIVVSITASDSTDYVRNIRLIMPGYQNTYQTQPFYTPYLNAIAPFQGPLRFMDAMQTNGQQLTDWSQRTTPESLTQAEPTGLAVEYMVDLCNETGKDMWVNMPYQADDAYVQNFAQDVHANLKPGLKVYVEYGNEEWNSGLPIFDYAYNYVEAYAQANGLNHDQATADLASHDWNIWRSVYGSQTGVTFLRVAANQFNVPWHLDQELKRLVATASPSDPDDGFDVVSGAPYFTPNTANYNASTTVQQIEFDATAAALALGPQLDAFLAVRNKWVQQLGHAIPAMMYEGGISFAQLSPSLPWYNAYLQTQTDPGMFQVTQTFIDILRQHGIDGINYYSFCQPINQHGPWGSMQSLSESSSQTPKYAALVDYTDGTLSLPAIAGPSVSGGTASMVAGTSRTITVTMRDPNGNVATGYLGTLHFTSKDPLAILPADYTFQPSDAGVHTFAITLETAGAQTVTVTDVANASLSATDAGLVVTPAAVASFSVTNFPSITPAGAAQNFEVTALDPYGNVASSYPGTVHFTSSDSAAILPADYTFTAADAGVHIFGAILNTARTQSITATDAVNSAAKGTESKIAVTSGAFVKLAFRPFPSSWTAGVAQSFTVIAQDVNGNPVSGYGGTVHFTSTDVRAILPADYTFTAGDAGTHTFSATMITAASRALKATDVSTGIAITNSRTTYPGAASVVAVAGYPATTTVGSANTFKVTLYDAYGNVATGYSGTIHFSTTSAQAVLPTSYPFGSVDAGTHTFSNAGLNTAGVQSITATDTANPNITGSQSGITVNPVAASRLVVTGFPSTTTVGAGQPLTVTAEDAYGNVATGYTGTVHFTTTSASANLPSDYTFGSGDAGTHTFSGVELNSLGIQSIGATDTSTSGMTGTESDIVVDRATASTLSITRFPSSTVAGEGQDLTVTAYDAYGNLATGYAGTVHFTTSSTLSSLPADYTFGAGDAGTHTFLDVALDTAGTQSITAVDTAASSIFGLAPGIVVVPASAQSFAVTGFPSMTTAGASHDVTVTALDPFGNVDTNYAGTVQFNSSALVANLPSEYTFVSGDAGVHTFTGAALGTAGTQSITATDIVRGIFGSEAGIGVDSTAVSTLGVSGFPSPTVAGEGQGLTVTAYDQYGNVVTGYAGTVHFTTSSTQCNLPADYTFTGIDGGSHTFPGVALDTAGTQSITATDTVGGMSGSEAGIVVHSAAGSTLGVSGFPSTTVAGEGHGLTVTAYDGYGNVATGYTGTVHLTTSSAVANLPADYTFGGGDAGVHIFTGVALNTTGTQAIRATDMAAGTITDSQVGITVNPAAAAEFAFSGYPVSTTAGVALDLTVTAEDVYGNVATSYARTVHFTSTDAKAVLPADYTFGGGDAGAHTFTGLILYTSGRQTVTVSGQSDPSVTPSTVATWVNAGPMASLRTFLPGTVAAAVPQAFFIRALDAYGNTATGYTGTVEITSTDARTALSETYTFQPSDAGYVASQVTLNTAGSQTVTVTDLGNGIQSSSSTRVQSAAAAMLSVSGFPATTTAGVAAQYTVTAQDTYGNVATSYQGTVHFTSTSRLANLPADYTFTVADAGVHTFTASLNTAGPQSITATDTLVPSFAGAQSGIVVSPAAASTLTVDYPVSTTAGTPESFIVTALDAYGNIASGYTGTVHFTSDDAQADLPDDYAYQTFEAGTHTFSATLKTAGTTAIRASDATNPAITGMDSAVAVTPAQAQSLVITGLPNPTTAGASNSFTVTAMDPYGNAATGYTGTVRIGSSDNKATLPSDYTFGGGDAGVHTFSGLVLRTSGAQALTASDVSSSTLAGTARTWVNSSQATALSVSGYPAATTAGESNPFTVSALDDYGNVATGYMGTVHFTTSSALASLPADYTFQASDSGTHVFFASLQAAGSQTLAATDTVSTTIAGSQPGIAVSPGPVSTFAVLGSFSTTTAGVAQTIMLRAIDAYGNPVPSYAGTVHFTSDDASAVLPTDYTFQPSDANGHAFVVTLKTAGTRSIRVTDTGNSAITRLFSGLQVAPGVAQGLSITGLANPVTAGSTDTFLVSARDAYGNVVPGFAGTVAITSSDSKATLPSNYTFRASDAGQHSFGVVLGKVGTQTVTATEASASLTPVTAKTWVNPGAMASLSVYMPSTTTAGVAQTFSVKALDAYGNTATGYTGTVRVTSSDPAAVLPANYTFGPLDAGLHTFSVTLSTLGYLSVTATDVASGIQASTTTHVVSSAGHLAVIGNGSVQSATGSGSGNNTPTQLVTGLSSDQQPVSHGRHARLPHGGPHPHGPVRRRMPRLGIRMR
jgi:hypothetical protein